MASQPRNEHWWMVRPQTWSPRTLVGTVPADERRHARLPICEWRGWLRVVGGLGVGSLLGLLVSVKSRLALRESGWGRGWSGYRPPAAKFPSSLRRSLCPQSLGRVRQEECQALHPAIREMGFPRRTCREVAARPLRQPCRVGGFRPGPVSQFVMKGSSSLMS